MGRNNIHQKSMNHRAFESNVSITKEDIFRARQPRRPIDKAKSRRVRAGIYVPAVVGNLRRCGDEAVQRKAHSGNQRDAPVHVFLEEACILGCN